ncbi:DUF1831 domain-containing protein [Lacticaseibacillus camelliae]|uniref:Cysteine desulfurase n=1 Tax=Lacticaseibacillus camelliae DSM 22697 = JCM 13995 TaxID=1423730 RepID=A0A0R2FB16_9LACO|nr:DUF1831 domain-containing protein [Lacticaseibacillus camelliae]KRN25555.1 hypothetical protein FC75_GL000285 [Lacticaseibacillus camelliae DSM 22697 = JCM 13995]
MALQATGSVLGDPKTYKISPQIKRYTLMDLGFVKTKNGNFQLERSLDPNSPFTQANKLKVTFKADLSGFQMGVTTANGLKAINIFKSDKTADNVEQYHFIIDNMIERQVLEEA